MKVGTEGRRSSNFQDFREASWISIHFKRNFGASRKFQFKRIEIRAWLENLNLLALSFGWPPESANKFDLKAKAQEC